MTITTLPLDAILASSSTDEFPQRRALSDVSSKIARCRKAVVISGAGISCSSGIPVSELAFTLLGIIPRVPRCAGVAALKSTRPTPVQAELRGRLEPMTQTSLLERFQVITILTFSLY